MSKSIKEVMICDRIFELHTIIVLMALWPLPLLLHIIARYPTSCNHGNEGAAVSVLIAIIARCILCGIFYLVKLC